VFTTRPPGTVFAFLAVFAYAVVSFRFPNKISYYLPAVPFVYLLLADWISARGLAIIAVAVSSYSVVSLEVKGG